MAATAIQLTANRVNAQHSTGPRSPEGMLASSRNSLSHGLTSRNALLPGEDAQEFEEHHQDYLVRFRPADPITRALVIELADIYWRLRRVPIFEAQLLNVEVNNLTTDPELASSIEGCTNEVQILAVAFRRLVESKVLSCLFHQEARLSRRAHRIERQLAQTPQPPEPIVENRKIEAILPLAPPQPIRTVKTGRNEPCPCRSGLKYKRCCLNKPAPSNQI